MRITSGGRGKIKAEKICNIPRYYENMNFLSKKHGLKYEDRIVVKITKKKGAYRFPFSSKQVVFKGTFGKFKEFAEKKAFEKRKKRQFPSKILELGERWKRESQKLLC